MQGPSSSNINGTFSGLSGGGYTPPTGGYSGGGMPSPQYWGGSGAGLISSANDDPVALHAAQNAGQGPTPPLADQNSNPAYTPQGPMQALTPEQWNAILAQRGVGPSMPGSGGDTSGGSGDPLGDPARWAQYNQSGYYQGLDPGAQSSLRSLLGL